MNSHRADQPANLLAGKRIVICEDEGVTLMQLSHALRNAGLDVVGRAGNGRDAVEMVLASAPDIVLMDINMPVMDGLEASRKILEVMRPCLIFLTAYGEQHYLKDAHSLGASGYITKPISADALVPQLALAYKAHCERRR